MKELLKSKNLAPGLDFHWVQDPKFKHNRLTLNFILPLAEETASKYAILPFLMRKGHRQCPDFTKLNAKLCELYGASLSGDVSKYGPYQVLELSISGIDNRFTLENEDMVTETARLLCQLATDPNIVDGKFPEKDMGLEKQFLKDTIEAEINNKRSYALNRCQAIMSEGGPLAVNKYGTTEQAEDLTAQIAADAYREMIDRASIQIMFIGSGDPGKAEAMFTRSFGQLERHPFAELDFQKVQKANTVKEQIDVMDVTQSKLVMGFRTGEVNSLEEFYATRLMTLIYGGTAFSKLFRNVREKMSLCYYCAARMDRLTGILMVDSGVEKQNIEKAREEILRQLKLMQEGEITEEELADAKLSIRNTLRSVSDSQRSIENWYLTQILWNQKICPEDEAEYICGITAEQVQKAAQKVTLDTVYLLTGKGEA